LTKPSAKPRTTVVQPAVPKVVTAPETVPPTLTNPANSPADPQDVTPPPQSLETAELTLSNPATEPQIAAKPEPDEREPRTLEWQRTTTGWVKAIKRLKPSMVIAQSSPKPPVEREPAFQSKPESAPRPREEREPADAIDRILETLKLGNVAFNAPKTMNLHETAVIQLMLGLTTPIDDLKQRIEAPGEKEGARIKVSDRMEARLSGSDFAITANTPEIQAVSRSTVTEWKWEVKPSSSGRRYLHLTLSAFLSVDGVSVQRAIRTFDKMIEVDVRWHQRVGSFFEKNWQWLWAAILVPIAGWLWRRKKASKPENQPTG